MVKDLRSDGWIELDGEVVQRQRGMGAFVDPRVEQYARLLVDRSLGVQPGWQVMIVATPLARPLVEELVRQIARKGAWPLVRLSWVDQEQVPFDTLWATEAPEELLGKMAPIEARTARRPRRVDADLRLGEHARGRRFWPAPRRRSSARRTSRSARRRLNAEIPWVGCLYPTDAARAGSRHDARRSTPTSSTALACVDWDARGRAHAPIRGPLRRRPTRCASSAQAPI